MTSLTYLVVNGLAGLRGTQLEWFISASHACPPVGLTRLLPMLVWEFQRVAKENKLQCISPFQTFTCVTFAKTPLPKASGMAKFRVNMGRITQEWILEVTNWAILQQWTTTWKNFWEIESSLENLRYQGRNLLEDEISRGSHFQRHFFSWYQ